MTAGRGIVHSEMPKVTDGELWGFQLWINLPAKDKMVKPRYQVNALDRVQALGFARDNVMGWTKMVKPRYQVGALVRIQALGFARVGQDGLPGGLHVGV